MASLTEQLDALIAEHGLSAITITQQRNSDGPGSFGCTTVSSTDGHFAVTTQGDPAARIASCITDIIAKRAVADANVIVEDLAPMQVAA